MRTIFDNARKLLPAEFVDAKAEEVIEEAARVLYECWDDQDGFVPWQDGGNSDKQCEARDRARKELEYLKRG